MIEKEIKFVREGKLTTARDIKSDALIIKAKDTPIWIPGLPTKYEREVKSTESNELLIEKKTNPTKVNKKAKDTTMWIPGLPTELNN